MGDRLGILRVLDFPFAPPHRVDWARVFRSISKCTHMENVFVICLISRTCAYKTRNLEVSDVYDKYHQESTGCVHFEIERKTRAQSTRCGGAKGKSTTRSIPRRSPIQVLTSPDQA